MKMSRMEIIFSPSGEVSIRNRTLKDMLAFEQDFRCQTCAALVWVSSAHGERRSAELSDQISERKCSACFKGVVA